MHTKYIVIYERSEAWMCFDARAIPVAVRYIRSICKIKTFLFSQMRRVASQFMNTYYLQVITL